MVTVVSHNKQTTEVVWLVTEMIAVLEDGRNCEWLQETEGITAGMAAATERPTRITRGWLQPLRGQPAQHSATHGQRAEWQRDFNTGCTEEIFDSVNVTQMESLGEIRKGESIYN